ncbi:MAG: hypothetical protein Q9208_003297 [Pyrenodesmia sp. 3 TL-2023]
MTSSDAPTHPFQFNVQPPPTSFLTGTWYVNYSTLPMWKDKRNVRITYTALTPSNPTEDSSTPRLDDLVEYQTLTSDKVKTIQGIDTPSGGDTTAWDWRGKGWLKIASSHWEFLDWDNTWDDGKEEWAVIWFQKTLFTPEGIDILSRRKEGVGDQALRIIKMYLSGRKEYGALSSWLFEVKRDGVPPARPV